MTSGSSGPRGSGPSRASLRAVALLLVALGTIVVVGTTFHAQYPPSQWLLTRVAGYWVLALYWALGCLAVGMEIVRRVALRQYRLSEEIVLGFPLGVLVFAGAVFVIGLSGRLGRAFFLLAPAILLVAGYPSLVRLGRSAPARRSLAGWRPSPVDVSAIAFGVLGMVAVYLPILTPHNAQHDAFWYHLPIAQSYAATGSVVRFSEGWFLGAYPHLSSLLYTWAFLLPAGIVHRVELCAHLEFVVFLATVASTPVVLRKVLPGTWLPASWAGFFLFPGFLVYDSTLSIGADHVAALWAPAGLLAVIPALRSLGWRHCALVGALAGGAAWTKYSAICIVAPLLGAVVVRAAGHVWAKRPARRAVVGPLAMLATFAICWAPHWLKNYMWYGDPLYPLLHEHFRLHPWNSQAASYLRVFLDYALLRPTRDLAGILETLKACATLGLRVNEFGFHWGVPTFGFLFTASLYCLPFVRVGWRALLAQALGFAAVFVWYWTNHRDRYLQACLPWLVVAALAVLASIWKQSGRAGRASVLVLVAAQLVTGAGVFLLPVHQMSPGAHALGPVIELIGAGYDQRARAGRFEPFSEWSFADWTALGRRLPPRARVLVHEDRLWVGLGAPVVVDEAQWQAGIRYGGLASSADVYDVLHLHGVTHVITGKSYGDGGGHGISGDLVFWDLLLSHARKIEALGKLTLWEVPRERPAPGKLGSALILTCNQSVLGGLYRFEQIRSGQPTREVPARAPVSDAVLDEAEFVIAEAGCEYDLSEARLSAFRKFTKRGDVEYWRRRLSAGP